MSIPQPTDPAASPETLALSGEQQRQMRICLIVFGVLAAAGWAGVLGFSYLVTDAPLLLIALSPLNRHLVLVAPKVAAWAFISVGVTRRLLTCATSFGLGRAVGTGAITWVQRNSPRTHRVVAWLERLFDRSAYVAILFLPGGVISLLAGISGMRLPVFLAWATAGLVLRMLVILQLGQWLLEPIEWLLDQIAQHRLEITLAIVAGVVLYQWRSRSRSRPQPPGSASGGLDLTAGAEDR